MINHISIAYVMKKSDFAILTPSSIINEAYYMGLPFIAIKVANNQDDIYKFLKAENYFVLGTFNKDKLGTLVKKMILQCKK